MTTLTLIYAADKDGNFCDPKTGKCWDVDRDFFRDTIAGKSIICGRKTFEMDGLGFAGAAHVIVFSKQPHRQISDRLIRHPAAYKCNFYVDNTIMHVLSSAQMMASPEKREEIFCIGGKQTIEALAPFASRVLLTSITPPDEGGFWLPDHINQERIFSDLAARTLWRYDIAGSGADYVRYNFRRTLPIEF